MASLSAYSSYKHFAVSSAAPFVAHVEINRPAKLNAFFEDMWLELGRLFGQLSVDPDVRAVVLSGAGDRAFTAGLDVQAASQNSTVFGGDENPDPARRAAPMRRHITEFQGCITAVEKCEKREAYDAPCRPAIDRIVTNMRLCIV
jgi:Delta3,5-Delta2,4-dienoyl-CoA isomerase